MKRPATLRRPRALARYFPCVLPAHLYVHVPFCSRRCSYCDFHIAVRREVPVDAYVSALAAELHLRFAGEPWGLETLYMGGGTPSKLGAEGVRRLVDTVAGRASFAERAELTLEVNPEDVTAAAARAWRDAGVNRLSIGIQSFDDAVLRWMHRTHDAEASRAAIAIARNAGFDNLSIDLIFALPALLGRDWDRDLSLAMEQDPDHLSVYGLTVEEGTPLGRWTARGDTLELPEEGYEREFLGAHRALTVSGYEHYEVSSYARPCRRSKHNAAYWARAPYAGIGPAAHSFDGLQRRWNVPTYTEWKARLDAERDPIADAEVLTAGSTEVEDSYLGLRTAEGVSMTTVKSESVAREVRGWIDAGWAELRSGRLSLTAEGWLRLDGLATALTGGGSRY